MKKRILFFFLFLLFFVNFFNAQSSLNDFQDGLDKIDNTNEQINDYTDKTYWDEKCDYLGQEWKNILLQKLKE